MTESARYKVGVLPFKTCRDTCIQSTQLSSEKFEAMSLFKFGGG